jgi:hypothetical protein
MMSPQILRAVYSVTVLTGELTALGSSMRCRFLTGLNADPQDVQRFV